MLYKNHLFSPPGFEYVTSPTNHSQAAHLPPTSPREQSSIIVETSAPYEIHYKTQRTMGMENIPRTGISDGPPSAAMKKFPLFAAASPPNHYNAVGDTLSDPGTGHPMMQGTKMLK